MNLLPATLWARGVWCIILACSQALDRVRLPAAPVNLKMKKISKLVLEAETEEDKILLGHLAEFLTALWDSPARSPSRAE